MYEVRVHGRGGQGAVTAAELLSVAAFHAGQRAQAFPSFGSERTGAPVAAFCRLDDQPIRLREPVLEPDALIVLDPTLLVLEEVFRGLRPTAVVLVNTPHDAGELPLPPDVTAVTVDATGIARRHLGRPLPNGVMLGAFAGVTGRIPVEGVQQALRERFPGEIGEANAAAAREAYDGTRTRQEVVLDA